MNQTTNDDLSELETETHADDADAADHADARLEKDDLFHLLKNSRRRRALQYLLDADSEPVRMRTLAEAVAADEYGKTVEALHSDERQRVYITLYQLHLPQLDEAGVIDYNQDRGRITTNPVIDEFEEYLGSADAHDRTASTTVPAEPVIAGFGGGGIMTLLLLGATGASVSIALAVVLATAVAAWLAVALR